jgi:hypothetical protein
VCEKERERVVYTRLNKTGRMYKSRVDVKLDTRYFLELMMAQPQTFSDFFPNFINLFKQMPKYACILKCKKKCRDRDDKSQ